MAREEQGADASSGDAAHEYFQWQVLERDERGHETWHAIRGLMSERNAHDWALKTGKTIRKVSSTGIAQAPFVPASDASGRA